MNPDGARLPPSWVNLLLDNISDAVMVTDCDGIIHYWSSGAERTFSYTPEEAQGRHVNLLYVPTEGEELQDAQLLAQDGEIISDVEAQMKRRDGGIRSVLLSIVPILGETGEVDFLACLGWQIRPDGIKRRIMPTFLDEHTNHRQFFVFAAVHQVHFHGVVALVHGVLAG